MLVAVVLAIGAVEVAIGWLITHPLKSTMAHESSINRWFADQRTGSLTEVADLGTLVGETLTGLVALAVIALGFAVWQRSLWPVLFVLALDGGIGLFYLASTTLDPRNRPPVHILQSGLVPDHSFPSGHTGTATAIAGALAALMWAYTRISRDLIALLAVIPVWTMLSRLYEGAHHLSDVLVALVVTLAWLTVCARLLLPARAGRRRCRSGRLEPPGYDAEQRDQGHGDAGSRHEPGGPADHHREDQRHRARDEQRDGDDHHLAQDVPDRDHPLLDVVAEDPPVQHDRRQVDAHGNAREHDQPEVQPLLPVVQTREVLGERQRQQEAREQLDPGLGHAQLLEQLVPVAVEPLVAGLVAVVGRHRASSLDPRPA
jgi:membrane-associated phospholipid phosphatase